MKYNDLNINQKITAKEMIDNPSSDFFKSLKAMKLFCSWEETINMLLYKVTT